MSSVITRVVTSTVTAKASSTSAAPTKVPAQGGILEGANPSAWNASNPITLFIIQAGIIIIFCRILHFPLSKIKQPRVIAEIIGGILLGPSVFGRIPGFTAAIFPTASMPVLNTAANLGLILFLFLVGLEVDLRLLLSNWRIALSVGAAGMALPFGLGCAIAYGLYHQFRTDSGLVPIKFGTYMLFVGVAMAITAFPVLCRILTELKLLQTQVGVVVLSAGVGNDVVGWILLALCVALVNAGAGITALYVLLTCVGYVLFLAYGIRPAFLWVLRRTGSIQNGPTQSVVALTVLMALASAFFTGIIGVHPIFGGFLIGLICPHEGGFAIKVTEKIEDLVTVLFLPLYFALSGLSTNIGLLNNGITWAYVIGVIAVAFFGKVVGGTLAARACKLVWRESFTVGILMSCKGLVELIVLNIGLQAKILSQRTFTIFVVMALVTTFATTPITAALYPPSYQKKLAAWRRGEIDWDGNRLTEDKSDQDDSSLEKRETGDIQKLLVCLRLDSLPSLFTFVTLLGGDRSSTATCKTHPQKSGNGVGEPTSELTLDASSHKKRPLRVHGLRMIELTERMSSVMKESEVDDYSSRDPVVNAFHTFAQLNNVAVSGEVQIAPEGSYAEILSGTASAQASDLVLLPWSATGTIAEPTTYLDPAQNPFSSGPHNQFVTRFLATAPCHAAIFVNNGFGALPREDPKPIARTTTGLSIWSNPGNPTEPIKDRGHHIFFPYFGGADDRVALRFVIRLARNSNVTATILHVNGAEHARPTTQEEEQAVNKTLGMTRSPVARHFQLPNVSTSDAPTAKETTSITVSPTQEAYSDTDATFFASIADSLPRDLAPRILFESLETATPLRDTVERARNEVGQNPRNAGDLVVVGRGKDGGKEGVLRRELISMLEGMGQPGGAGAEARGALGDLAEAMIVGNVKGSVVVVQAGATGTEV